MPYKDPEKRRESTRIRMQKFRERHKDDPKFKENVIKWRKINWSRHGKKYNKKHKQWYAENREERLAKMKQYREKNKSILNEKKKAYNKHRRKTNTNFLIKSRLRCLIYNSVKLYGQGKKVEKSKTYGLNLNEIAEHLSNTKPLDFNEQLYHIDHIIPLASFNLSKSSEVKKAFNKNNLQWLPAIENIKKSNNQPTI
jgi:hypothetical protein